MQKKVILKNKKIQILFYDGQTINKKMKNTNFSFSKSDFNLSSILNLNTTTYIKIKKIQKILKCMKIHMKKYFKLI